MDIDTGPSNAGAMESQPHTVVTDEMVADFVFCPRFAHLKWVQGESADSGGADSGGAEETRASTSHWLSLTRMSWDALGVSVGIERIEYESGESLPVRTCSVGRAEGATASASDAVALCIQGLVLRANSHLCNAGLLHYEGDGTTLRVSFDGKLLARLTTPCSSCARCWQSPVLQYRWRARTNVRTAHTRSPACRMR